jgi:hypothetical protein
MFVQSPIKSKRGYSVAGALEHGGARVPMQHRQNDIFNHFLRVSIGFDLRVMIDIEGSLVMQFSSYADRGSSHRRKIAAFGLAISLACPGVEEGGVLLVQMISTWLHGARKGEEVGTLWFRFLYCWFDVSLYGISSLFLVGL